MGINLNITLFISFTLLFIFTFHVFLSPFSPPSTPYPKSNLYYQHTYLSLASNYTISHYHRTLTRHPHLSGTPGSHHITHLILTHFQSLNLPTKLAEYDVMLSYPTHVSLTARFPGVGIRDIYASDAPVGSGVVPPYHAYAPSGTAVGLAVYVNYGREEDYNALAEVGVTVKGCVVVVRRGEEAAVSRGEAVRVAGERGAVAVVMYTEGVHEKGVERGTVMKGLGDPLTPGWGSVKGGGERLRRGDDEVEKRFPKIPSMPISEESGESILRTLEGAQVPLIWRTAVGKSKFERVGPGPTLLNFSYQGEEKMATIHDVFAVIRGSEEPDRYVLLGNHRDAWTYGGVDPNSGTAALLDVARRYASLISEGWRPRRTIILCSWDAEEFGMVGSTEWVEENIMNLGSKAVAYLNVDCAAQGSGLFASMTPQLDDLFVDIAKKVKDPDREGATIYEQWTTRNKGINIQRLSGVDSDFASFLQHAGVPSLDIYYGNDFRVYHTAFDSHEWMLSHGDPLFHRHVAVVGLWGLLALRLADDPILPFNFCSYATQLREHTNTLISMLGAHVSFTPITTSIEMLLTAAKKVEEEVKKLREDRSLGDLGILNKRMLNDRLMLVERGLLDADGLQGSPWFKHLVYGPSSSHEIKLGFFPSIANAMAQSAQVNMSGNQTAIQHEIWRVARAIQRAAAALSGDLT